MERKYSKSRVAKKVGDLVDNLIHDRKAVLVEAHGYMEVYSIKSPEIAVVARTGTDGTEVATSYTAIGRKEDIGEFEKLLA
ncbi:MAG: hypothetical protein ABSG05_01210 [Candidatus Pacearchaeota archaeon]|jgi:hypothetical protein